jgi:hypothetical protein
MLVLQSLLLLIAGVTVVACIPATAGIPADVGVPLVPHVAGLHALVLLAFLLESLLLLVSKLILESIF